jgi:hypothetical protein
LRLDASKAMLKFDVLAKIESLLFFDLEENPLTIHQKSNIASLFLAFTMLAPHVPEALGLCANV